VGSYWVGVFFLLFSTFLVFDLCTGFGLWLRPQLPALRTLALIIALLMTILALVQARRSPEVTEYEVTLDGLPREADGTVLVAATDMHMGVLLGHGWANERAAQFESLRPDLLLLVGDIFEGNEASYPSWLVDCLRNLVVRCDIGRHQIVIKLPLRAVRVLLGNGLRDILQA
jgi:hypothetical protein